MRAAQACSVAHGFKMNQHRPHINNSFANDLSVVTSFLLFGLASGLLFASLVSRSSLQSFFFVKGDKLLIPTYWYWFTFGLAQLLGLGCAYSVCVLRRWGRAPVSSKRLLCVAVMIGFATPGLRFLTPLMNNRMGLDWDFVAAPIAFLFILSCTLCVFSGKVKLLPIAVVWNLLFLVAGFGLVYVFAQIIGRTDRYEFVQWPLLYGMLGLSFGNWLIWRQRVHWDEDTQAVLVREGVEYR